MASLDLIGRGQRPIGSIILLAAILWIALWRYNAYLYARKYKLPPRIPGIPIFGNALQIPPLKQGKWGIEMARKYGEM
jgi:hypothetical protein